MHQDINMKIILQVKKMCKESFLLHKVFQKSRTERRKKIQKHEKRTFSN